MWTNQRTQQNDTLVSLARAYNVSIDKLLAANSIRTMSEHTDSYLSKRAQECMIPSNLPRKTLSKLILEQDIQRWIHAVGGDCPPLHAGSRADTMRLLSCAPGEFCHFSSESIINLPQKKRLREFAGLGALSVMDTVAYLNSVKQWAKDFGDYVVNNANTNEDTVDSWRDGFVAGMNGRINVATRADSSGIPAFVRDPSLIQKVADFAASKANEAKQFNRSLADRLSAMAAEVQAGVASAMRSVADAISPGTAATPPAAKTPASSKKDASALASVRAGASTLKRGEKGPSVTELQTMLRQVGLSVGVDGDFGNNTKGGVEDFQKFRNLTANGVLDAATLRDLDAVAAAGGKVILGKKSSGGTAKSAKAAVATIPAVVEPVAPPVVQTSSSNTMLYAAVGLGVLLVAGAALARR